MLPAQSQVTADLQICKQCGHQCTAEQMVSHQGYRRPCQGVGTVSSADGWQPPLAVESGHTQQTIVSCMGCHASCLRAAICKHQHRHSKCHGKGFFTVTMRTPDTAKVVGGGWHNPKQAPKSKSQPPALPMYGEGYWEGDHDVMAWDQDDAQDQEERWPSKLLLASGPPYTWSGSVHGYRTMQPEAAKRLPSGLKKTERPAQDSALFNQLAREAHEDLACRAKILRDESIADAGPHLSPDEDFFKAHDQQVEQASKQLRANPSMLAIVDFIQDCHIVEADADRLLKILASPDFKAASVGFSSWNELKRCYDSIMPTLFKVKSDIVVIPDKDGRPVELRRRDGTPVMFYYHNLWERALLMYRDPRLAKHLILQPQPQHRTLPCGRVVRVYNTISSGLLFQEMLRMVPPQHVVVAPILYSDEATRLTKCSAYPMYCEYFPSVPQWCSQASYPDQHHPH